MDKIVLLYKLLNELLKQIPKMLTMMLMIYREPS